jgi:hypothetical protein
MPKPRLTTKTVAAPSEYCRGLEVMRLILLRVARSVVALLRRCVKGNDGEVLRREFMVQLWHGRDNNCCRRLPLNGH